MSQQAKKEQVIKLRESGLSFGEIAKQLSISRSTVSSMLIVKDYHPLVSLDRG